jgi:SAM-dependent methyltransferase
MKKVASKLFKLLTIMQLRSEYLRKKIDFPKLLSSLGICVRSSLDVGSGPEPKNPFLASEVYGVDIRSYDINKKVKKCSIGTEKIPFEDNYFDAITAFDVLEHIPRVSSSDSGTVFPFVEAMNELWRVLKIDGLFYSETPCFPMKEAFQDPTHVNIMTEDTLRLYFADCAWARIYGFKGSFRLVKEGWKGSHYCCVLQKISEMPVDGLNSPQQ